MHCTGRICQPDVPPLYRGIRTGTEMLWISQLAEKCGDLRFKNKTGRRVGRCRSLLKLCKRQHYGKMRKIHFSLLRIILSVSGCESATGTTDRVTISVQNAEPGAPVKFGIP